MLSIFAVVVAVKPARVMLVYPSFAGRATIILHKARRRGGMLPDPRYPNRGRVTAASDRFR
jgi:hypothetical protein